MTWARFLQTGSGSLAVRISVEGLPTEFVSDPAMEKTTSDGRVRVYSLPQLQDNPITIDESVNVPEAKLEGRGISITLFETQDEALAQCFAWRPDVEHFVEATISQTDTTIHLLSAADINADDVVHIGTEAIKVGAVASTSLTGCTRAYWGSIAQRHHSNDGNTIPYRMLHNRPLRIRGRRARVYAYSDGDDMQGDGTQIWLGQITSEPRCDEAGGRWQLQIASIAERLKGKLGGDLDRPVSPRGIYYSWASPLWIRIAEESDVSSLVDGIEVKFTGFFASQEEFCTALSATLSSGFLAEFPVGDVKNKYRAVKTDDGLWTISVSTHVDVTRYSVQMSSPIDGDYEHDSSTGTTAVWKTSLPGARSVPRGAYGKPDVYDETTRRDVLVSLDWPEHRVYVDRTPGNWTSALVEWAADGVHESFEGSQAIVGRDITDNWIDLMEPGEADGGVHLYTSSVVATFSPTLLLAEGSVADLRDALVTIGPEYANRGVAPFLTSADLADWTDVVDENVRLLWQRNRQWALAGSADLEEVIGAELRLVGLFPIIDSIGKIALAPIILPNASTVGVTQINDEIVTAGWASMERGGQTINRVQLKTGYDPREDDWTGRTIDVIDMTSYAFDHEDRPLTIEPRSVVAVSIANTKNGEGFVRQDKLISEFDVSTAFGPVLNLFGYPHDFISVNVSWKLFGLTLGSVVSFSAIHLPDYRFGIRPMQNVVGIVVGRKWELGKEHGTLRILISWQNIAGYSPTARVTSQLNTAGNTWELTIAQTAASGGTVGLYAPSGTVPEQFFAAGHRVRIVKYDSESAGAIAGTVTAVDTITHKITVTFDGVWTPGAFTWELIFARFDDPLTTDAQRTFAAIANSAARLIPNSGAPSVTNNPRTYGP